MERSRIDDIAVLACAAPVKNIPVIRVPMARGFTQPRIVALLFEHTSDEPFDPHIRFVICMPGNAATRRAGTDGSCGADKWEA